MAIADEQDAPNDVDKVALPLASVTALRPLLEVDPGAETSDRSAGCQTLFMRTIDELLELDTDGLLAEIGEASSPDLLAPRSFREAVELGREWVAAHVEELQARVCPHADKIGSGVGPAEIIAALIDVLASIEGIPSVAAVSVLIFRFGVKRFCEDASLA